jgi:hypothetical protein
MMSFGEYDPVVQHIMQDGWLGGIEIRSSDAGLGRLGHRSFLCFCRGCRFRAAA